jgi:putative sigma-54 modulation protein
MEVQRGMNITVTGRHMEMTDALKSYVEAGLQKLRVHFDKAAVADVVLTVEKHRHIAEMSLHANGIRIHGKESSSDMYASVDVVLDKIGKQVQKYKDRINRHQPRTSKESRNYQHQVLEYIPERENASPEAPLHRVINREKLPMKPMSVDEAMMQLDLVDDAFLVFFNADTQQVNVLYGVDNGTFGLIEPQF